DELNSEQEVNEEVSYRFLENNYNARKITLRAIIDEVGSENIKEIWKVSDLCSKKTSYTLSSYSFHISMVPLRWYKDSYQENQLYKDEAIIFNYKKGIVDKEYYRVIGSIQRQSTVPRILTTKKILQKRTHYSKIWGLAHEATLLAVDI
ncbi:17795_t:CDS:2, partial [Gigaspora margarita]